MNNIILIGMPASGKSTLGVMLAKMLGYDFLDTDLLLQRRAGMTLQEILDTEGEARFAMREEETLLSVDVEKTVIATGGSAVYSERGMAHLKTLGKVVYLAVPLSHLTQRLTNLSTRGVLMPKGQTLATLFAERKALYERYADITFHQDECHPSPTMAESVTALYQSLRSGDN